MDYKVSKTALCSSNQTFQFLVATKKIENSNVDWDELVHRRGLWMFPRWVHHVRSRIFSLNMATPVLQRVRQIMQTSLTSKGFDRLAKTVKERNISCIIHSKYFPVTDWLKPHARVLVSMGTLPTPPSYYSQRASRMNEQLQTFIKYFIHRFDFSIMK